jgi:hypothetical protein
MSLDDLLLTFLGEDILRELLRPSPVPTFTAETARPGAK